MLARKVPSGIRKTILPKKERKGFFWAKEQKVQRSREAGQPWYVSEREKISYSRNEEQLLMLSTVRDNWGDNDSLNAQNRPVKSIVPRVIGTAVALIWPSHTVYICRTVTLNPQNYVQLLCQLKIKMSNKKGGSKDWKAACWLERVTGGHTGRRERGEHGRQDGGLVTAAAFIESSFRLWLRRWAWQGPWQAVWEASCLGDIEAGPNCQ